MINDLLHEATSGNVEAMRKIGMEYLLGKSIAQNAPEGINWLEKASISGDPKAPYFLVRLYSCRIHEVYEKHENAFTNEAKAFSLAFEHANSGNMYCQYLLSVLYRNGEGTNIDRDKALKWTRKSAEGGFADAQYQLAVMYLKGETVGQNDNEAFFWMGKAASAGDLEAIKFFNTVNNVGYSCKVGDSEPEHIEHIISSSLTSSSDKAKLNFLLTAAREGVAEAQATIGVKLIQGTEIKQNYFEAYKWLQKAAKQESAIACYSLGWLYLNGFGVNQSEAEALQWMIKAADSGHPAAIRYVKEHL